MFPSQSHTRLRALLWKKLELETYLENTNKIDVSVVNIVRIKIGFTPKRSMTFMLIHIFNPGQHGQS